jgi:hypothetical protein
VQAPRRDRLLDEDAFGAVAFGAVALGGDSDEVLSESLRRSKAPAGTLAAFLKQGATVQEKRNLTDLVRTVETFEASRGLAPSHRVPEPDGCVTVLLGPCLRVELRFRIADC